MNGDYVDVKNEEFNERHNIIPISIKPKTIHRQYRGHNYIVEYTPKTKKWKWTVTVTTTSKFSETADTMVKAYREAEKFIDQTCPERK